MSRSKKTTLTKIDWWLPLKVSNVYNFEDYFWSSIQSFHSYTLAEAVSPGIGAIRVNIISALTGPEIGEN